MRRAEVFRGGVHFLSGALAFAMGLYNLSRTQDADAKPRHVVNAFVYLGLVCPWEAVNTYHHWSSSSE